jgi:hypothetical protein
LYFAIDCPQPPVAGRYKLYIPTTINLVYFTTQTFTTSKTLYAAQTGWQYPDAVTITFNQISTPFVSSINPAEGDPGISLNITGVTDLNDTSGINSSILLNPNVPSTYVCSLPATPTALVYNQDSSYTCQTVSNIVAGLYNFSQQTSRGYAYNLSQTSFYNFDQSISYNVAIHPIVYSVSPQTGFSNGQIITINGAGFSPNSSQVMVNVSYAGYPCNVLNTSLNSITCQLSPIDLTTAATSGSSLGSSGLTLEIFQGYTQTLNALAFDTTTADT